MKTNRLYARYRMTFILLLILLACGEDKVGPLLPDSSTFVAPAFKNAPTSASMEFTPENAADVFETFQWEKTQYGVQLSTDYVVEVDKDPGFSSPFTLAESASTTTAVTVEDFNNAMLALGLPAFEESTVYIRIKSSINGYESEPLYSGVIERTATPYRTSECGNFCAMGIIGDATAGGWDVDTDLRLADPTKVDKYTWTTVLYLSGGKSVKFRASDDWTDNWGGDTFENGTGTKNGPNISVPADGYYKVTFNDNTGAYTFTALAAPEYATMGIIGDATSGGWDSDTDLTRDANDPHLWTGTITLSAGSVKFRADNDWANNWGSDTAPSGFGTSGGANIPVAVGGTFFVRFNDATGAYSLMVPASSTPYPTVGLIGTAQAGGWDTDTDLVKNPTNPFLWSKIITTTDGEGKFRADNDWAANWGSTTFPAGAGIQNGPNIPVTGGKYFVTFNSGTGEYYFLK